MRAPAKIKRWLSTEKMAKWAENAPDEASLAKRSAVWLTQNKRLHAEEVAEILGVSIQAVWLWVGQYNAKGPKGLRRKGRGGKRWAFMSTEEESELLKPFIRQVRLGKPAKTGMIKEAAEKKIGRRVSLPYIYKLLQRHGWGVI